MHNESIVMHRERGELKHLSNPRKRKKHRFPQYWRAKGEEPKPERSGVMDCISELKDSRMVLGKPTEEGESPVDEIRRQRQYPEYHETRETLWEVGGTTPQG